ncbi:MAG: hypothetical protein ACP5RW_00095 [bacterium]
MNEEIKKPMEEKELQPLYTQSDIIKGFILSELLSLPISIRKKII